MYTSVQRDGQARETTPAASAPTAAAHLEDAKRRVRVCVCYIVYIYIYR